MKTFLAFLKLTLCFTLILSILVGGVWFVFHTANKEIIMDENNDGVEDSYVNALLLGVDKDGTRTDVIIFAQLDLIDGTVNMLQIPRDTYVEINKVDKKINSAYGYNKEDEVFKEVEYLLGVEVSKYILVNTKGFRDIIDAIGGVDFNVPINMNYDDPVQDFHIHLKKGQQLLDGEKAEMLVRFRQNNDGSGYAMGDIDRIAVQKEFMNAAIDKIFSMRSIFKIPKFVSIAQDNVSTNFSATQIAQYAPKVLKLEQGGIQIHQLPGGTRDGSPYYFIDKTLTKELIDTHFTPSTDSVNSAELNKRDENLDIDEEDIKEANPSFVPEKKWSNRFTVVTLIDGTNGEADIDKYVDTLTEYGYKIGTVSDTGGVVYPYSIVFAEKNNKKGDIICNLFGISQFTVDKNNTPNADVTIIIGKE